MFNYYILSDTHFGHEKMKEYCGRKDGFEWKIMKSLDVIKKEDILIHLGDFCIGRDDYWHNEFIHRVEGKKILIIGNHDRKTTGWYLERWDFVCNALELSIYGKKLLLTHEPRPSGDHYDINIHGHLHEDKHRIQEKIDDKKHYLISLELDGYQPQSLRKICEKYI